MMQILIVNNNMHIGGVQKSLVNLLHAIHNDYAITLLLFYPGGELLKEIPSDVKVITSSRHLQYWGMTKNDTTGLLSRVGRGFWGAVTRLFGREFAFKLIYPFCKKLSGYDTAISFLHSGSEKVFYGGCNEFVSYCIKAQRKVTFLHCDYSKINAYSSYNAKIYSKFDMIAACSEGCKKAFLKLMPQFSEKTVVVPNCQNYEKLKQLAQNESILMETDKLNILTVSRFGAEKGILRAISAFAALGAKTQAIRYYIIGDGAEYSKAVETVADLGLTDTIFLLGEIENPYGYMKAAHVLLIPSVSEAAPMVIGEAAYLGTPILTTETSSARELVDKTNFGWVCENSVEGIKNGIETLLSDPDELQKKKQYLHTINFDNAQSLNAFSEVVK